MKKSLIFLLVTLLIFATFVGCSNPKTNEKLNKFSIVVTTFPQYDWVRQILGAQETDYELTLLLDSGVDLHSFEPSVEDIAKISDCDMFIYVGGESDDWVDDALKIATNKDMIIINLIETMGSNVKNEEIVEGMESENEKDNENEEEHEHDADIREEDNNRDENHEHESEVDEHVWLSLKNAQQLCNSISNELTKLDPQNSSTFEKNTNEYNKKLAALDSQFEIAVSEANKKVLLFGDRFPFRYFVDDYNLDYYAAFSGCSAETEASFETIVFLANKVDEFSLINIMVLENSSHSIAETIISNTDNKNQQVLVIDSMQSLTKEDVKPGISYLAIMKSNHDVIKEALK